MIKINLLGKKKPQVPFNLDEKLERLGFKPGDFELYKPALIKFGIMLLGIYLADFANSYYYNRKLAEVGQNVQVLEDRRNNLQTELTAKKDLRKQMEQLNKEEFELQRQVSAINGINQDRNVAFQTLDAVTSMLPAKVWLLTISVQKDKVNLSGSSWEFFPINEFIKSVTENTMFSAVNFRWIKAEEVKNLVPGVPEAAQKIKNFELDMSLKIAGGS